MSYRLSLKWLAFLITINVILNAFAFFEPSPVEERFVSVQEFLCQTQTTINAPCETPQLTKLLPSIAVGLNSTSSIKKLNHHFLLATASLLELASFKSQYFVGISDFFIASNLYKSASSRGPPAHS